MKIKDFVIHRIDKKQRTDPTVHLRPSVLSTNGSQVERFTTMAVEVFEANEDKPSSVYADFNTDATTYPFSAWCLDYFNGKKDFLPFTNDCTNRLAALMKSQPLSTGGFVVFATFENDGGTKLLVVMLHPQAGLSITEALEFEEVTHLELKHIDKAALITSPAKGAFGTKPLAYAGFRKAMSIYFQDFVGPDAFRNPNKDSHQLIETLEDYARDNAFDSGKLDEARVKLRKYAQECTDANEELDLNAVSAIIHSTKPKAFAMYAASRGISAYIKPDNSVFKRWKVIRYKSSDGLVLQFKAETVGKPGSNRRLEFDEKQRTLTITKLEDDLMDKIKTAQTLPK